MARQGLRVWMQRQDALVVARLRPGSRFFFVCCAGGIAELLGRPLARGERVVIELNAKEVRHVAGT